MSQKWHNLQNRKKNSLTLQERLEVLEKLKNGESSSNLAVEYCVHRSTIGRIKSTEHQIALKKKIINDCDGDLNKKRFRGTESTLFEKALYQWFNEQRAAGEPIRGNNLKAKARQLNTLLSHRTNFQASDGWLCRFKQRHGIKSMAMHKETLVKSKQINNEDSSLDDSVDSSVSHYEAYQAVNTLINYYESDKSTNSHNFLLLLSKVHQNIYRKVHSEDINK